MQTTGTLLVIGVVALYGAAGTAVAERAAAIDRDAAIVKVARHLNRKVVSANQPDSTSFRRA